MTYMKQAVCTAVLSVLLTGTALAEEAGREEYRNSCAACHGATAAGDGPLAELMTVPVPALTGLSAANDGKFPMLYVIHTIDGRQGIKGHGYPMPTWGNRFKKGADSTDPYSTEVMVRGRVLSLAYYLESIQE